MSEPGAGDLPLFSLRGVRVDLAGRTALSVDRLLLPGGPVLALTGDNGSGKTTLLRLLNGLVAPAAGTVEYRGSPLWADGRPGAGMVRLRSDSVMVHQAVLLFRGTVGWNVSYGLRIRGVSRGEAARRVASVLERLGLGGMGKRRSTELSGGQKRLVSVARALVLEPKVLLLDEPAADVDPAGRRTLEEILRGASEAGTGVLASSHDAEFAYRLSDRLLALERGRVLPVRENVFRGRVEEADERRTVFRTGSVALECPARRGDFRVAVLPFADVILSDGPLESSARNRLAGAVTSLETEEGLLRVTVDCGIPVRSLITRASAEALGVAAGRRLWVTCKATSIRLY